MSKEEEILKQTVKEVAAKHNFVNNEIKIEPISSGGANYTSNLYNVTIKEGNNNHYIFAKVAPMPETMRADAQKLYDTEIFVYSELLNIYQGFEASHQVPQEHRLKLPQFYGCNSALYEETLLLEDLVAKGYQPYDRFKSITWEYALSAVKELVKLHALSFAYGEYNKVGFEKVSGELKYEYNMTNGPVFMYYQFARDKALQTVQEKNRDLLKDYFEAFPAENYTDIYQPILKPVLIHGDFRPSNLMHKIRDDGTVEIKIVDLQTMHGNSPVVDLLVLIFVGSDEQFRAQYYEKLIDFYYKELETAMKRLHLDTKKVYSRGDFDYELKEKLPYGLSVAVFTLPAVTGAPEDDADKKTDLYSERINGIVNDCIKWGVLKPKEETKTPPLK